MQRVRGAAAAPRTWLLAALFLAVIDAGVTRTSVLWGRTAFEDTREIGRVVFAQTYQAARKIYAPAPATGARRVALLGNSRLWLPGREAFLQPVLDRMAPARPVRAENLAIFGAGLGDLEVVSRHLGRLAPALVVVTLSGSDLIDTPSSPIAGVPARLLAVGWRDGPLRADGTARLERWGRTVWPLFRFREFARAAIHDRVLGLVDGVVPPPDGRPFPDHFADTRALFAYMHGAKAEVVERAYRAWRAEPTLERFVAYLEIGSATHLAMVRGRVREGTAITSATPALRVLEALLARVATGPAHARVLLMPENPLLALDTEEQFHRPGFSDDAAAAIAEVAARHGVAVVDARRWMPTEAFIDFDHLMPGLSGFQEPLAAEIVRALDG